MATSSIGRTTVVKRESGDALLRAIRKYKAKVASRRNVVAPTSISNARDVGMRR